MGTSQILPESLVVDGKQGTIDDVDDGADGDAVTGECQQSGGR